MWIFIKWISGFPKQCTDQAAQIVLLQWKKLCVKVYSSGVSSPGFTQTLCYVAHEVQTLPSSASSGAAQCPSSPSPGLLQDTWHPQAGSKWHSSVHGEKGRRRGKQIGSLFSHIVLLPQLNSFCRKTTFTCSLSQVPTIFSSMSMPIFASLCLSSVAISACR